MALAIGVDLGHEDRGGRPGRPRPRTAPTAAADAAVGLRGDVGGDRRAGARGGGRSWAGPAARWASATLGRSRPRPACSRTATRPGSTVARSTGPDRQAGPPGRAPANDANCLGLSEATDGAGAGAEVVFTVILGSGVGGERGGEPPGGRRGQRRGRRVGPYPAAAAAAGRAARARVLLRPLRLRRDLAVRPRPRRGPSPPLGGMPHCTPEIIARRGRRPVRRDHAAPLRGPLARGLANIVNLLDPEVIVLRRGSPTCGGSTPTSPPAGSATSSPTRCARGSCHPCTATARACGAPPGSGATSPGPEPRGLNCSPAARTSRASRGRVERELAVIELTSWRTPPSERSNEISNCGSASSSASPSPK